MWVEKADGSILSLPRAWTDRTEPEPFVVLSGGKAHFRPHDLVALVELVAGFRGGGGPRKGGEDV